MKATEKDRVRFREISSEESILASPDGTGIEAESLGGRAGGN